MRTLLDRFRDGAGCVGVEFTDRLVRLLQVRMWRGRLDVAGISTQMMPRGAEPGADQDALAARLRSAVVAGGFVGRRCAVSLARSDVEMYATRFPEMPSDELAEAVRWDAAERLGMDHLAIEADYIRTGAKTEGERQEILIIATPSQIIERRLEAVMAAGLRPMAVDTHFGAVARLFTQHHRRDADQDVIRAVIEVGDTSSTLIVLHGDRIALCRSLDIGGCHFDARVADQLGLDIDAASELRQARLQPMAGIDVATIDPATDRAVHECLRPLFEELSRDILMSLRYYGVTFKGQKPVRLMLAGAEAREPGLAHAISRSCGMAVELDDELGTLSTLESSLLNVKSHAGGSASAWVTASGLSLRSLVMSKSRRNAGRLERAA
jgi:type IV pilus assembly protein PilM